MILPTSNVAGHTAGAGTGGPTGSNAVLSSDFETFLKMLTAQARFQDPLEPIDSSEYAAQLAQFSMVEQQVLSNDLLTALTAQLGSGGMAQMAGWIGMEALSTAPAYFDGSPITINPNPAAISDEVFLVVYDETGTEVQRMSIPVSAEPVEWAGVAEDGTPFAQGLYSFEIESRADGEVVLTDPVATYGRITEARVQDGQTVLILEGGAAVLASAVSGLREPAGSSPSAGSSAGGSSAGTTSRRG
ncbi:flagellar hook capping FlgD N-terminal domain-containing protein [Sulfitobacter sp. PR48]|uniref:flagellar hook capping FlgD N-terminal domain-containing protein n=1 Tax=Sulfitobacter sp. PR48 TaxID=3028383 RepID=UPI00237AEF4C|nr:flagellar hook capping FlgD N-terminal domain-containing protein [Sulfitobacter sp. PR48]MDD9719453.1 flagellar hook capping FlgD N-terminal domain-containing protein [Sulfitobacter sp. PR48]